MQVTLKTLESVRSENKAHFAYSQVRNANELLEKIGMDESEKRLAKSKFRSVGGGA